MDDGEIGHCGRGECKIVQLKNGVGHDCMCDCRVCAESLMKLVDTFMKTPPPCMCETGWKCQIHPQEGSVN